MICSRSLFSSLYHASQLRATIRQHIQNVFVPSIGAAYVPLSSRVVSPIRQVKVWGLVCFTILIEYSAGRTYTYAFRDAIIDTFASVGHIP